jgi:hypothetical protein
MSTCLCLCLCLCLRLCLVCVCVLICVVVDVCACTTSVRRVSVCICLARRTHSAPLTRSIENTFCGERILRNLHTAHCLTHQNLTCRTASLSSLRLSLLLRIHTRTRSSLCERACIRTRTRSSLCAYAHGCSRTHTHTLLPVRTRSSLCAHQHR